MPRLDAGGKTWRRVSTVNVAGGKAPYSFNQIKVNPFNDQVVLGDADADPDLAQAYASFTVEVMTLVDQGRRNRGKHHA